MVTIILYIAVRADCLSHSRQRIVICVLNTLITFRLNQCSARSICIAYFETDINIASFRSKCLYRKHSHQHDECQQDTQNSFLHIEKTSLHLLYTIALRGGKLVQPARAKWHAVYPLVLP